MDRAKILSMAAKEFAHDHKDILVIMADPKTDQMFAAYNNSFILGTIKQQHGGGNEPVVKSVLLYSKFNKSLTKFGTFKAKADVFLMNLSELLWLKIHKAPEFFKFISDALWYLPKGKTSATEAQEQKLLPSQKQEEKVTLDEVLSGRTSEK